MTGQRDDPAPEIAGAQAAGDHVRAELVRFIRSLRRSGVAVPPNAGTTAARALADLGFQSQDHVRTALRATLLADRADFATFDRLFEEFWQRLLAGIERNVSPLDATEISTAKLAPMGGSGELDHPDRSGDNDGATPDRHDDQSSGESFGAVVTNESETENAEGTDRALYSPTGKTTAVTTFPVGHHSFDTAFQELTRALSGLQDRRWRTGDDRHDIRRALRESFTTGGTVFSLPGREHQQSAVRALLLVDVSRSVLDTVDRSFLIQFLQSATHYWKGVRTFFFDEELRDVTDAINVESAKSAVAALERAQTDWGGGTRIGDSFGTLRETAPMAVDRRTVVFVVSDGLEMGNIDVLEREAAWLDRRASRVLWLNPLAAAEGYEPTARGMAAVLPYLDGLFAFTRPADLEEMATQLRREGFGGRVGYVFDSRRSHA